MYKFLHISLCMTNKNGPCASTYILMKIAKLIYGPFNFVSLISRWVLRKKKLHRTVINCFGILLYFLSTKPWHQRLPKYHAVSWLPRVVIWWQISCSDSFWVTKISLSTLSSQCLDSGIHSPAMPWCTSLATFFKKNEVLAQSAASENL